MDLAQVLPGDVLEDVLGRLPPRSLAACRCVCKALRAAVDDRRMLRADLLPLQVRGIFLASTAGRRSTEFVARTSTSDPVIHSKLDFLPTLEMQTAELRGHCDGLLLLSQTPLQDRRVILSQTVVNPATRWWAPLPPPPPRPAGMEYGQHLVFDPTSAPSPHYEVFMIPTFPHYNHNFEEPLLAKESEWPPSPFALHVFSSMTGRWEEKLFIRRGEAAGTVADMRLNRGIKYHGVYCKEALYAPCGKDFVIRISLLNNWYQVIKPPEGIEEGYRYCDHDIKLGKSKNRVHCTSVHDCNQLQIWWLDESGGKMEWVLKRHINFGALLSYEYNYEREYNKAYSYEREYSEDDTYGPDDDDTDSYEQDSNEGDSYKVAEKIIEWDSDGDVVLDIKNEIGYFRESIYFLGFHPYKDVIFLYLSTGRAVAYHLNRFEVLGLGDIGTTSDQYRIDYDYMVESFMYTPCLMGEIPKNI